MTAAELLESLNTLDEHDRIEAKRGSEVGKSILETICAFANEPGLGGGWLLLGVTREELALFPSFEVEGVSQPDKVSADVATQCRETFNRPVRVEITTESLDGKAVIVVGVLEVQPQEKPIFFKSTGLPRGAFRRIGSTDQRCTDDDLAVFYQGRDQETFDASIVTDASFSDLSPEALADYRRSRAEANPDAEELRWSDHELLEALGCIRHPIGIGGAKAFGLGDGELQRTDTPVIPQRVIREALVNALMHRTYRSNGRCKSFATLTD